MLWVVNTADFGDQTLHPPKPPTHPSPGQHVALIISSHAVLKKQ